ncbi:MAG: DUF1080 domain-containing protein [bacterium]
MSRLWTVIAVATLMLGSSPLAAQSGGWTNLLDRDLSRWERYLSYRHQPGYDGSVPKRPNGDSIPPIGYNIDDTKVFSVVDDHGTPVLRVSGEVYGALFTRAEYSNYHLRLRVKWGTKKWPPRTDLLRDSGILYHSIGAAGADYWRAWKLAQEFQIMEGHMGDYWNIASSAADIRAFIPEGKMNPVAGNAQQFIPIGNGSTYGGFCLRTASFESPPGEWTQIDLITIGDKSLHIVNGHVVMVLQHSRYTDGARVTPLTRGQIQIQSEAGEVFYRDIQIKPLGAMPKEYAPYFESRSTALTLPTSR